MNSLIELIYSSLVDILEVSIQLIFVSKVLNKKLSLIKSALFIALGFLAISLDIPVLFKILLFFTVLFTYSLMVLKENLYNSLVYSILALEISQLCHGILNSITMILSPTLYYLNPLIFGWVFMIAGDLLSMLMSVLCYHFILKYTNSRKEIKKQYLFMLLIPMIAILSVSNYINYTFYGNSIFMAHAYSTPDKNHVQMLVIQILSVISILSVMYTYQKLIDNLLLSTKLSILTQQSRFQKQYIEESKSHYMNTQSLRHDMKNHILVIKGLLENSDFLRAKNYIDKIDTAISTLSFPFSTGNTVLDILLEKKSTIAQEKHISFNSSLILPSCCNISDMDFCIILSNALDNAINACNNMNSNEKKYIDISGRIQEGLLLIEISNSFNGNPNFQEDIGLYSIRLIAEKYNGTVDISIEGKQFRLSILLVIS